MFALLALIAFVVGGVLEWDKTAHAMTFLFIGLACLAAQGVAPLVPWRRV